MFITKKVYDSELTDEQWCIVEPLIPKTKTKGRPRTTDIREVLNAILYIGRTGCQWRLLPEKYPPRSTIFEYFSNWKHDGTWDLINTTLRELVREKAGRNKAPTAAIIDSQTVKSTEESFKDSGYNGGKKNQGS